MDLQTVYLIIVLGLTILFALSFTFFIRRLLINSSARRNGINKMESKFNRIIEQNEKIISLLEQKNNFPSSNQSTV